MLWFRSVISKVAHIDLRGLLQLTTLSDPRQQKKCGVLEMKMGVVNLIDSLIFIYLYYTIYNKKLFYFFSMYKL